MGLRKLQVMRIGRRPAADQAGLAGDKPEMISIASAGWSLDQEPEVCGWSR
jgi:hypothetical protein